MWRSITEIADAIRARIQPRSTFAKSLQLPKYLGEWEYWRNRKREEGALSAAHYEYFYTLHFGLQRNDFVGKKILDIGSGPRGSLEWADHSRLRIGLDPLAIAYREFGTRAHRMLYVAAAAERMPFADGAFDVVCSFNSLDHTDDPEMVAREVARILGPGGLFLLLTDVHPHPTPLEPAAFSWNVTTKFDLALVEEKHYEKTKRGMYESILAGAYYDHLNTSERYGVLSAKFARPS